MKFDANPPRGGGGKNYIKLESGQSISGVFRGEPHDFFVHWLDKKSAECSGDSCQHCKNGDRARFRFRINFVTAENGALIAKVFESNGAVYDQLKALNDECDLEWTKVKITRQGQGQQTNYYVMPLPKQEWKPETEKQINEIKLNDLSGNSRSSVDQQEDGEGEFL